MKRLLITVVNRRTLHNLKRLSEESGKSVGDCIDFLITEYVNNRSDTALNKVVLAKSVTQEGIIRNARITTDYLIQSATIDEADNAYLIDGEATT